MPQTGDSADSESLELRLEVAEARAAHAESLLDAVLNCTADAVFVKDNDGRYLAINSAGAKALRLEPHEVIGRTNFELIPEDHARRLREGEERLLATSDPEHTEDEVVTDGVSRWYLMARGACRDASGTITGIVGVATDITERKRREVEALLLAEAGRVLAQTLDYRTTLNAVAQLLTPALADWCSVVLSMPDGRLETLAVAHTDPEKVRWAKEAGERYPSDPDGPGVGTVIRTGQSELYPDIPDEMLTLGAKDAEHLEMLRMLGMSSVLIVPMSAHGRTLGAITLICAESGRVFTERDLPIAEELARRSALAIENAELFREVGRANRAKSEFLASMSHELRTPLNAIMGYAELLAEGITGTVSSAQRDQIERIRASARHLLGLIDEVLSYSRMEAGKEQVTLEVITVTQLLDEAASLVRPLANDKRLELDVKRGPDALTITSDVLKVRQILVNLLTNAVKFTDTGSISLGAASDGDDVLLTVQDTGIGVAPEAQERVFEAFWQVEQSASRRVGGTGLGLSVSRRLARLLGGDLTMKSTQGEGSTFTVRLPRVAPDASAAPRPAKQ